MPRVPITRYEFHRVSPSELVIFDKTGAKTLLDCDLPLRPYILYTRLEKVNLNLRTLFHSVSKFFTTREKRLSYCFAMIKQLSPRVVLTFIDNDPVFHRISNIFPNIQFIAVQNGWRFPDIPNPLNIEGQFNSHLLCFGQNEIVNYERRGVRFKEASPIGSLKVALANKRPKNLTESDDSHNARLSVVYISSGGGRIDNWDNSPEHISRLRFELRSLGLPDNPRPAASFWDSLGGPAQIDSERLTSGWLVRSHTDETLRTPFDVSIALRNSPGDSEFEPEWRFFRKQGFSEDQLCIRTHPLGAYERIFLADVVLTSGSTLGIEALAMGKRVLISQPVAGELQKPDFHLPWWLINHNYSEFLAALQQLLALTDEDFCSQYKEAIEYYVIQGNNPSADEVVRRAVARGLNESLLAKGLTEGLEPATHAL